MGVKYSFIIVSDGVNRLFCKEVWQDEENRYWVEYNIHIWLVKSVRYIVMRSIIEQIKSVLFTQIPKGQLKRRALLSAYNTDGLVVFDEIKKRNEVMYVKSMYDANRIIANF